MKSLRLFAVGLSAMLILTQAVGCSSGQKNAQESPVPNTEQTKKEEPKPAETKKMKFAVCMSHQQNEFVLTLTNSIKEKAKELGVDLVVNDAQQNAEKQVGQVESLIAQHIDGIIIEPVSVDGLKPAIEAAANAKVPIVTINQKVANQDKASAFVGVAHEEGGKLEMEYAAKLLNGKGNIVILDGPMGSDAQVGRGKGYKDVLAKNPNMKVVAEQSANWVRADALAIMENWIQSGKSIDAVISQNDDMALGALKAVEDAKKLDQIKVFGIDATPDGLKNVKDGKIAATVSQNTEKQGATAMEAVVKIAKGEKVDKEIIVSHVAISKDNVEQYIKK